MSSEYITIEESNTIQENADDIIEYFKKKGLSPSMSGLILCWAVARMAMANKNVQGLEGVKKATHDQLDEFFSVLEREARKEAS